MVTPTEQLVEAVQDTLAQAIEDNVYTTDALARAALKAIHDAGYAIVPREPTAQMLKAGMAEAATDLASEYRAMVKATPIGSMAD